MAACAIFTVTAALVPTIGEKVSTRSSAVPPSAGELALPGAPAATAAEPGAAPRPVAGGPSTGPARSAEQAGRPARSGAASGPAGASAGRSGPAASAASAAPASAGGPAAAPPRLGPCPDRAKQVPRDPYSPACFTFTGDNGGATSRGVTADTILLSVRIFDFSDFGVDASEGPAASIVFDKEQLKDTLSGLIQYFNSRFQFYGRRLVPHYWEGKGDLLAEFQGAGQEGAEADAVRVAEEIKPFGEILSLTVPYSDGLSRRQVMNMGSPYLSAEWHTERAPYAWSSSPDCTFVMQAVSDYLLKRVANRPAARAGAGLQGKPRRLGLIAPENPWYQQCLDVGDRALRDNGAPAAVRLAYKLDFTTASNQAASLVPKLRSAGVTTVVCLCDAGLPLFLTTKAQEQGYEPEWLVSGTIFMDDDNVAQAYQQDQWSRAFGLSFKGASQPVRSTYGYFAYKTMRPNGEPIALVDYLYYHLYMLVLGVQLAGPNLTVQSWEAGLRSYPGGTGPIGTWRFPPGRYTPTQDAREITWDRDKVSVMNNKPGAYTEPEPGRRYRPGEWRAEP